MKAIVFLSLCLCSIGSQGAKPPLFLSYQDSIGQYSFGYSEPMSARSEYRSSDGVTRGTYSYVDHNGLIQTAEYEAGKDLGFRVKATNLPQAPLPVQETPEVLAARDKHLRLLEEAMRREEMERAMQMNEHMQRMQMINPEPRSAASTIMSEDAGSAAQMEVKSIDAQSMTEARYAGPRTILAPEDGSRVMGNEMRAPMPIVQEAAQPRDQKEATIQPPVPIQAPMPIQAAMHIQARIPIQVPMTIRAPMPEQAPMPIQAPTPIQARMSIQAAIQKAAAPQPEQRAQIDPKSAPQPNPQQPMAFPTQAFPSPAAAYMVPQPVDYTPEVMAAREAHFRAYETAAKLAAETDLNPQLLEKLLRGQPVLEPAQLSNKVEGENRETAPADPRASTDSKVSYPAKMTVMLNVADNEPARESMVTGVGERKDMAMEKARPIEAPKGVELPKLGSGLTPASTSLRLMDIRFPSLNEFQQTKLKAGAYNTPIEISHLSPTNVLPKPYHPFIGSSSFYVYL